MELRAHDLLRLGSPGAVETVDAPDWVRPTLEAAPWVVVRRGTAMPGRIPVGVRGGDRSERFAAFVDAALVIERVAPEDMGSGGRAAPPRAHRVLDALDALRPALDAAGLVWGPTGGAGFEIATGRPVLTGTSDLDLLVRMEPPFDAAALRHVAALVEGRGVRVDVVVETAAGGFALGEFVQTGDALLLKTAQGPRLVAKATLLEGAAA